MQTNANDLNWRLIDTFTNLLYLDSVPGPRALSPNESPVFSVLVIWRVSCNELAYDLAGALRFLLSFKMPLMMIGAVQANSTARTNCDEQCCDRRTRLFARLWSVMSNTYDTVLMRSR